MSSRRSDDSWVAAKLASQIEAAKRLPTFGVSCEGCGRFMTFEFPVTFWSPPLCVSCDPEWGDEDV